jgi:molybdate transport system substrate-binding protein
MSECWWNNIIQLNDLSKIRGIFMFLRKICCIYVLLFINIQVMAADITLLASTGVSSMMKVVLLDFEKKTGHHIKVSYDTSNLLMKRIQAGESVDLVILTAPLIDELTQSGKLTSGSRVDLAKSGIGVAIQSGKTKPDISSPEALKKALLETSSVAYTATGASGIYFSKVITSISDGILQKIKSFEMLPKNNLKLNFFIKKLQ